nr:YgiT-type zinc finger protein [uncultured Rhodopila sp.]
MVAPFADPDAILATPPIDPVCPETGAPMHRDTRPMTLTWQGETITLGMPGWYCDTSEESIHSGQDMKMSDRMLKLLRARHLASR